MLLQAEIVWGIAALLIAVVVIAVVATSIRVVPEFMRLVVFRLGRLVGLRGPGLVFLIPVVDQAYPVDLREQVIDVTKQTCITKDNAPVDIDLLIYLKVVDPEKVITQVQNFKQAAVGIATTTLRAVVGDIELDEVLAKREYINSVLRAKLDEVTARWGVKVT
ncbi:MAG: paraslipin, partial [Pyrobaculum sp.]